MRHLDGHPLDPETVASLEVIDATLAGEPVDPRHAEVAELSLLLADERPAIDPAFARSLDERVKRRFAGVREVGAFAGGSGTRRRWGWLAAGGAAAALAAVVVIVIVLGSGSRQRIVGQISPTPSASGSAAARSASRSKSPSASGSSSSSGSLSLSATATSQSRPARPLQPPSNGRKIVQAAQLYLSTPPDHVDDVAQEVFDVVGQENGIVVRSSVTQTGGTDGSASVQVSVPSSSLPQTMFKLSRLAYARVASRTDSTQDVNNQYGQATRRLADARALRTALLKQLANAITTQQIDSLQAQIHDAERSISSDEAALGALSHRIAFSDVSATIGARPQPAARPSRHGGGFTLGSAAHDAARVVTVVAGVALIALAALVPLGLVAGLAWWVIGRLTHRHRERALDLA